MVVHCLINDIRCGSAVKLILNAPLKNYDLYSSVSISSFTLQYLELWSCRMDLVHNLNFITIQFTIPRNISKLKSDLTHSCGKKKSRWYRPCARSGVWRWPSPCIHSGKPEVDVLVPYWIYKKKGVGQNCFWPTPYKKRPVPKMQIHLGETLPDSPMIVHAPPALLFTIIFTLQNPPGFINPWPP